MIQGNGTWDAVTITIIEDIAPPCTGDLNGNGGVDFDDLNIFINAFQTQNLIADFNTNGGVDFDDLNIFINAFQTGCP